MSASDSLQRWSQWGGGNFCPFPLLLQSLDSPIMLFLGGGALLFHKGAALKGHFVLPQKEGRAKRSCPTDGKSTLSTEICHEIQPNDAKLSLKPGTRIELGSSPLFGPFSIIITSYHITSTQNEIAARLIPWQCCIVPATLWLSSTVPSAPMMDLWCWHRKQLFDWRPLFCACINYQADMDPSPRKTIVDESES